MELLELFKHMHNDTKILVKRLINNKPCEVLFDGVVGHVKKLIEQGCVIPFANSKIFIISNDIISHLDIQHELCVIVPIIIYVVI